MNNPPPIQHPVMGFVDRSSRGTAVLPALLFTATRVGFIVFAYFLLHGLGEGLLRAIGLNPQPDPHRMTAVFACICVLCARQLLWVWYICPYTFGYIPALMIGVFVPFVSGTLALMALCAPWPFSWIDVIGLVLFYVGSLIETTAELQRKFYKDDPKNKGKLYTGGLFVLAQHINFFGELLWYTGLSALSANVPLMLVTPFFLAVHFCVVAIPELQVHLKKRYGSQWTALQRRGVKLMIPFVF